MNGKLVLVLAALLLASAMTTAGCDDEQDETADGDDGAKASKKKKDMEQKEEEPPKGDFGPTISIPAGKLMAGSRCYDVPRIRPDELEHEAISMGAFEMDLYPYPNDPGEPARLDVNWYEAKQLCEERGKRLCTEMEWERACKGPKNTTYMWGDGFKKGLCDGQPDHRTSARPLCKTGFGVMDMVGVALEWTASDWERGTKTGDKVVRGARPEKVSWLSARCTHSRKRDPNQKYDNVGFRCCSGEESIATVRLEQRKRSTITDEGKADRELERILIKAMPSNHRAIRGAEVAFDRVYRWRPVPNEEMIVARWRGKPKDGDPFYEIAVFKLCGSQAFKAATMRGPVEDVGKPKVGINPRKISFDVETGSRRGTVGLSYWHGTVKLTQPDFVKKGNQLKVKAGKALRLPKLRMKR